MGVEGKWRFKVLYTHRVLLLERRLSARRARVTMARLVWRIVAPLIQDEIRLPAGSFRSCLDQEHGQDGKLANHNGHGPEFSLLGVRWHMLTSI